MPERHVVKARGGRDVALHARKGEWRSLPSFPMGPYAIIDPHAIPPPNLGHKMRAGMLVTEQTLLQVDVIFTSLRLITNAILDMSAARACQEALNPENIPYLKFQSSQPEILWNTWGGRMMQYDGMRRTIMSLGLFQEAFWFVLGRDRLAYPEALDVLHPAYMEIKDRGGGEPEYIYGSSNKKRKLDPDDVLHIPFMSMPQEARSLKTADHLGISAALAMAAIEFGSSWFTQGSAPSFLLSTDAKLGQDEVERIADRFQIQHAGLGQAHTPLVIDNGLKADKVMASPDEAQYLNTLEYARNVVASWFGTDELISNALQRQTPPPAHTAQERMQRFVTLTLSGYTVPIEAAFEKILPGKLKARFDKGKLLKPDPQFLAAEIEALRNTQAATINDIRVRKLGWPPLENPAADEAITPLASNTAPSQTPTLPGGPPSTEPATPAPSGSAPVPVSSNGGPK